MRRIVTGHNKVGRSIITMDAPPARSIGEDVGGLFELWNTDGSDIISTDSFDRADEEIILSPPDGGTKFRYFQINPLPEGVPEEMMQEIAADAFEDYRIGGTEVSAKEINLLKKLLKGEHASFEDEGISKREWSELQKKFDLK